MKTKQVADDIDAVVSWVDGGDRNFVNLKNKYHRLEKSNSYSPEEFGEHRYVESGELEFAIHSILKYAPFIRTIYIVHSQTELIEALLPKIIPHEAREKVIAIHHATIFRGYEEYLPTFNSLTIETMIHRLPGLSERYIYFNDDFLLLRQTCPTDFFRNNLPICSGYLAKTKSIAVKYDSQKALSSKTVGFVIPMKNIIKLLNGSDSDLFVRLYHSPYVFRKSTLVNFFEINDLALRRNISYKFRSYDQFSTAALAATLEYRRQKIKPTSLFRHIYLKPVKQFPGYCVLKILPYLLFKRVLFGCIQNLSESKPQTKEFLKRWLRATESQKNKSLISSVRTILSCIVLTTKKRIN